MSDFIFEWDPDKNKLNIQKHGISFHEAESVFSDDNLLYWPDDKHSGQEERFMVMGMSSYPRILLVCHCIRDGIKVRIISAREATLNEKQIYESR